MPAGCRASDPRQRCCQRRSEMGRSEEHTSELQSRSDLVCRLLLEKKNKKRQRPVNQDRQKYSCAESQERATGPAVTPPQFRVSRGLTLRGIPAIPQPRARRKSVDA